jgi:hypothetical protein
MCFAFIYALLGCISFGTGNVTTGRWVYLPDN